MRKFFIFFVLIISFFALFSQKKNVLFIENNVHSGYVVNNFLRFDSFPKLSPALLNEFNIGYKTLGSKTWHQYYNYPEIGVIILAGNVGNKRQLGSTIGIIPNISLRFKKGDNFIKTTVGWSFSYFNKPYDSITNPNNILIGSHLVATLVASLYFQKNLGNNYYLNFAGSYIHSSNGHYQAPNGGLNLGTASIGIKKYFGDIDRIIEQKRLDKREKTDIYLQFGYGVSEFSGVIKPVGTPKFDTYTVTLLYSRNYNFYGKYFIGFAARYYEAYNYHIVKDNIYDHNIILKSSIFSFMLGNEFQFNHFAFYMQGALDFYTPFILYNFKNKDKHSLNDVLELLISNKLAMKYYIFNPHSASSNVYISLGLASNFGGADFPEASLGFVF